MIKIKKCFDLDSTITCGQIFRYSKFEDGYIVIIKDRVLYLKENGEFILVESNNEENLESIINQYFDLNRDYDSILKNIKFSDQGMVKVVEDNRGLKMINQDPLETIIAYIISQNNRVPSIAKSLDIISEKYGTCVSFKDKDYYLFPSLEKLYNLTIEDFRNCKVGFRDKYLYGIVHSIKDGSLDLNGISSMDSDTAMKYLMSFKGIGMKVASCILLFSYERLDVYPIDTWVKKFMKDNYNIEGEKNIRSFVSDTYGEYSGLIIQYMFNSKRNK